MKRRLVVFLMVVAVMVFLSGIQAAEAFKPMSINHTTYGISQFIVTEASGEYDYPLRLTNPTNVTQLACVITYDQVQVNDGDFGPNTSSFEGCECTQIGPHTNARIYTDFAYIGHDYSETVIAPIKPVFAGGVQTFFADMLGMIPFNRDPGVRVGLVHPSLFTLPTDPYDRQSVLDCLCGAAGDVGQLAMWRGLGVSCLR